MQKYKTPRDGLPSEALKKKNFEFILNGYRNKKIADSGKITANSLFSLMVDPPCVADSTFFLNIFFAIVYKLEHFSADVKAS